jgi:acetyl-CoA carboxylase carboxyl transferase alpha subunit
MRLFSLAERLGLPVVTFIDTPGAFPGPAAEERGVAEAIARSISMLSTLRTAVVTVITGEGGSGGALALAVADVVLALENSIYSVISPEGCASILWRTAERAPDAAVAMRLTAVDQAALGVIDHVVAEPEGGAHTDHEETARLLRPVLVAQLASLEGRPRDEVVEARYLRFRSMGAFDELQVVAPRRQDRPRFGNRLRSLLAGRIDPGGRDGTPLRPAAADETDEPPLREEV